MNYETLKTIPTSRNGKMIYGIASAFAAREMLNSGLAMMQTKPDGAMMAFLMTGVLLFTTLLAIVRYDTGRPLFESLKQAE